MSLDFAAIGFVEMAQDARRDNLQATTATILDVDDGIHRLERLYHFWDLDALEESATRVAKRAVGLGRRRRCRFGGFFRNFKGAVCDVDERVVVISRQFAVTRKVVVVSVLSSSPC